MTTDPRPLHTPTDARVAIPAGPAEGRPFGPALPAPRKPTPRSDWRPARLSRA